MSFAGAGYPDFLRIDQRTSNLIVNEVATALTADRTFGPFIVAGWDGLQIRSPQLSSPPGWKMTFTWWTDTAMTTSLGTLVYRSGQGHPIADSQPNLGPVFSIDVHATSYVGSPLFTMQVLARNGLGYRTRDVRDAILASINGLVVNAGASATLGVGRISPGPATWNVKIASGPWQAVVQSLDENLTTTNILSMSDDNTHAGKTSPVNLPPTEVQIVLTNLDVANRQMDTALILGL